MFGDWTAPVRSFRPGPRGVGTCTHISRISNLARHVPVRQRIIVHSRMMWSRVCTSVRPTVRVTPPHLARRIGWRSHKQANVTRRYTGRSSAAFHTKRLVLDRSTLADGSAKTYLVYRQSCVWSSSTTRILGLQDHRPSRNHTCPSCSRLYLSIHPCISEHLTKN